MVKEIIQKKLKLLNSGIVITYVSVSQGHILMFAKEKYTRTHWIEIVKIHQKKKSSNWLLETVLPSENLDWVF
jgi:hypothetical protein